MRSDVTPEWLTDVLRQAGALAESAAVRSFEMAPIGTGQMADTTRFTLTLDEPGAGPAHVVGKFASADDQSRGTGLALRAYEIEVRFYREVAARIGARVPAVYLAEVEPETGWFTLLMEDIAGAAQGDQIAACSPGIAAAVLDEMAGLHAPCWEVPELEAPGVAQPGHPGVRRFSRRPAAVAPPRFPGALRRHARPGAPAGVPPLRRAPAGLSASAGRAPHRQPRRLPSRQPPVPAGRPEARGRRLADRGLGRRLRRRGVLHRRLPQHRGPPRPRAGTAGALPRRPGPSWRPRLHARAAARRQPDATPLPAS